MQSLETRRSCGITSSTRYFPRDFPCTKTGDLKRRLTWDEKLRILDPTSPLEKTQERLEVFGNLFCFRLAGGIITRVGQGPRAWTAPRGRIRRFHAIRHLL